VPIPIPAPGVLDDPALPVPNTGAATRPYYLRQHQDWAVEQERQRHIQALYQIGEWAIFVLMWHQADFEAGLVGRCSRCYGASGSVDNRVASVYNQPTQNECPVCFGTTFEGGYRALIVRPAMITDADETDKLDRRGSMHPSNVGVETTIDFRTRQGDYMIRSDNTRWQLTTPRRIQLRTGFDHADQEMDGTAYNNFNAKLEERTTVAYRIPPTSGAVVRMYLSVPMSKPGDFGRIEEIHGPLLTNTILD
jgi:hypothetical protein